MNHIELPYPTADFAPGEMAPEVTSDSVTCICGNADNFSAADRTGRLAYIQIGEVPAGLAELPDQPALAVCNNCGRIYDDVNLSDGDAIISYVVGRIDTTSPEWVVARDLYFRENFGD